MQTKTTLVFALVALSAIASTVSACGGAKGEMCSGMCAVGQFCHGTDGDCYCSGLEANKSPSDFQTEDDWHIYTNQTALTNVLQSICKHLEAHPASRKFSFIEVEGSETKTFTMECEAGMLRAVEWRDNIDFTTRKPILTGVPTPTNGTK